MRLSKPERVFSVINGWVNYDRIGRTKLCWTTMVKSSMESFLPCLHFFEWTDYTCLDPIMGFCLRSLNPERYLLKMDMIIDQIKLGQVYEIFCQSFVLWSFLRRFLFQQNLEGEDSSSWSISQNMGKERRTCCPPTPFSHFWYLTVVKPRFSATTRSSSFNDARSARAVIWAYLLYLNG